MSGEPTVIDSSAVQRLLRCPSGGSSEGNFHQADVSWRSMQMSSQRPRWPCHNSSKQMKNNLGMLERILERPSVENSSASASDTSRTASLASDLKPEERPKPQVNGSSQTRYLRSAFLDVRLQESPTNSGVRCLSVPCIDAAPYTFCPGIISSDGCKLILTLDNVINRAAFSISCAYDRDQAVRKEKLQ